MRFKFEIALCTAKVELVLGINGPVLEAFIYLQNFSSLPSSNTGGENYFKFFLHGN